MGIAINVNLGAAGIRMILQCDNRHGLFVPPECVIPGDNFIAAHANAMRIGWKETFDAQGRHIWLCPECSGKVAA